MLLPFQGCQRPVERFVRKAIRARFSAVGYPVQHTKSKAWRSPVQHRLGKKGPKKDGKKGQVLRPGENARYSDTPLLAGSEANLEIAFLAVKAKNSSFIRKNSFQKIEIGLRLG